MRNFNRRMTQFMNESCINHAILRRIFLILVPCSIAFFTVELSLLPPEPGSLLSIPRQLEHRFHFEFASIIAVFQLASPAIVKHFEFACAPFSRVGPELYNVVCRKISRLHYATQIKFVSIFIPGWNTRPIASGFEGILKIPGVQLSMTR